MPLLLHVTTYVCLKGHCTQVSQQHTVEIRVNMAHNLQNHQIHYNSIATNICFYSGQNENIQNTYWKQFFTLMLSNTAFSPLFLEFSRSRTSKSQRTTDLKSYVSKCHFMYPSVWYENRKERYTSKT